MRLLQYTPLHSTGALVTPMNYILGSQLAVCIYIIIIIIITKLEFIKEYHIGDSVTTIVDFYMVYIFMIYHYSSVVYRLRGNIISSIKINKY